MSNNLRCDVETAPLSCQTANPQQMGPGGSTAPAHTEPEPPSGEGSSSGEMQDAVHQWNCHLRVISWTNLATVVQVQSSFLCHRPLQSVVGQYKDQSRLVWNYGREPSPGLQYHTELNLSPYAQLHQNIQASQQTLATARLLFHSQVWDFCPKMNDRSHELYVSWFTVFILQMNHILSILTFLESGVCRLINQD